jgi:hypothetical protein
VEVLFWGDRDRLLLITVKDMFTGKTLLDNKAAVRLI